MTDSTHHSAHMTHDRRRHQMSRGEYSFYFALIFVAALPICTLQFLFAALRTGGAGFLGVKNSPAHRGGHRSAVRSGQWYTAGDEPLSYPAAGASRRQYIFSGEKPWLIKLT